MTYEEKYKDALNYIDSYWDKIIIKPDQFQKWKKLIKINPDKKFRNYLDIPNAFISPNDQKFKHIFYWDTYFMFRGLMGTRRQWVLKSTVNNFIYLFRHYGVIPNFNSPASSGRSQPPFLTSMIIDTYENPGIESLSSLGVFKYLKTFNYNRNWLINSIAVAKQEYASVWEDEEGLFNHKVKEIGLNRYGDRDVGYAHSSEIESGWDFTSRFYNRCNEFIPVDLNSYLFKYEKDFEKNAIFFENNKKTKFWKKKSETRLRLMNKYLWNPKEGFFFDYNYKYAKQSKFMSLAGFTPMWAGLATPEQARKMVKKLKSFETSSGLTITDEKSLAPQVDTSVLPPDYRIGVDYDLKPKQWDYPYIWPPLEYLTVVGLLKYGFTKDASRIMQKSLKAWNEIFRRHGTFFEKMISDTSDAPADFHYKNQAGFGWTNAVFYRYIKILDSMDSKTGIYLDQKGKKPPYQLNISV